MENELVGAIKNALERGETIEHASSTLRNAGYPQQEIAKALNIFSYRSDIKPPTYPIKPFQQPSSSTSKIIILLIALMILIIIITTLIFFSDKIPYLQDLGIKDTLTNLINTYIP